MLLKGMEKVGAEASLSVLAYNIKRAINVVGLKGLIRVVRLNAFYCPIGGKEEIGDVFVRQPAICNAISN